MSDKALISSGETSPFHWSSRVRVQTEVKSSDYPQNICQVYGFFARHFSPCRQSKKTTRGGTILRTKRLPTGRPRLLVQVVQRPQARQRNADDHAALSQPSFNSSTVLGYFCNGTFV